MSLGCQAESQEMALRGTASKGASGRPGGDSLPAFLLYDLGRWLNPLCFSFPVCPGVIVPASWGQAPQGHAGLEPVKQSRLRDAHQVITMSSEGPPKAGLVPSSVPSMGGFWGNPPPPLLSSLSLLRAHVRCSGAQPPAVLRDKHSWGLAQEPG